VKRNGQVSSWAELERSAELVACDAKGAEGLVVCRELQEKLDATEARVVFADTPWIPGEMKEVVDAVLGCTPIGPWFIALWPVAHQGCPARQVPRKSRDVSLHLDSAVPESHVGASTTTHLAQLSYFSSPMRSTKSSRR
jgi:hypothetical protein